jgi:regulator of protease activity HflC (stomatin/prohibitin superfamily)
MNITVVVSAIAGLSWVIVVALLVLVILRITRQQRVRALTTGLIVSLLFALVINTVSAGLVFIEPQERGVVISALQQGIRPEALQPGLKWVVPYFENVVTYSISRQTYTMSITHVEGDIQGDDSVEARTSDGQVVKIDASIIFAIDPTEVTDVHIKWQNQYVNNLVRPQARGVIREAVSQFGVEEVYSIKRSELNQQLNEKMAAKLEEGGLLLVDFVLRNITFSDEYAQSVEQKQIAEQKAQEAAFVVEQRKQEAEQARQTAQGLADAAVLEAEGKAKSRVIAANAEAEAVVIQANANAEARLIQAQAEQEALEFIALALAANPDLLNYEYIQKLAPGIQVMLVPNDNPYLLPLPSLESGENAGAVDATVLPTPSVVVTDTTP